EVLEQRIGGILALREGGDGDRPHELDVLVGERRMQQAIREDRPRGVDAIGRGADAEGRPVALGLDAHLATRARHGAPEAVTRVRSEERRVGKEYRYRWMQ